MRRLRDIPPTDRPREKMMRKGVAALSDLELLAVLLGSGTAGRDVLAVSREALKLLATGPESLSRDNIAKIEGIGPAKGCQLLAAFELARRHLIKTETPAIQNAEQVVALTRDLRTKQQEHFVTLTLDGAHRLIHRRTVFIGTLNESLVHPREVFADALTDRAAAMILVHNHPSGQASPSEEDHAVTQRLTEAGRLLGISVLDHIIISNCGYYSFNEIGAMKILPYSAS